MANEHLVPPSYVERIREDFCPQCKFKKEICDGICSKFIPESGICIRFEWASQKEKKTYQEQVLDNQASTIWMEKGTSWEVIDKMSRTKLRSVLTKKHYEQFDKEEKETQKQLKAWLAKEKGQTVEAEQAIKNTYTLHCKKPDGTKVTYQRSTITKTYSTNIATLKASLARQGIEILKEEIT